MDAENIRTLLQVAEFILGGFCYVLWRNFETTKKKLDDTTKEFQDFKLHASETYSTKNDLSKAIEQFSRSIDAVFLKLERIEDKLDSKQDKVK